MGPCAPDSPAVLYRRPHSRCAEIRELLGHPSRRGKAPGPPFCPKAGEAPCLQSFGQCLPDAPDEHPLPAGHVHGRGTGHGGRPPAGHRYGGAEYYYFTGQPEKAARAAAAYLTGPDMGAQLSACLIYAYANLSLHQIQHARFALDEVQMFLTEGAEQTPLRKAAAAFVAATSAVLLHLPLPESLPSTQEFLPLLPTGLRAFALYVQAHYLYLHQNYTQSIGIVESTLAMGAEQYPITAIYLHLMAVMDYMSMRQTETARNHLLAAWALARPDDLIEGFGEHHGLLGGMLEAVIKPRWPEDFRRIIDITGHFSWGWRPPGGGQPDFDRVCGGDAGGAGLDDR